MKTPTIRRRTFVVGLSTIGLSVTARGTDNGGEVGATGSRDASTSPTSTVTTTDTSSATTTQGGSSSLTVGEASLVTIDEGHQESVGGEVAITNEGDATTGTFTVGLDWLDSNGEYLTTSDISGQALEPGETWSARALAWLDVDNPANIGGVEAFLADVSNNSYQPPTGIELTEEQFRASEQQVLLRGQVKNNRQSTEFIEIAAKVYAGDGVIIGMDWTIEEVAAGATWEFQIEPDTYGRNSEAESGKIYPYID